MIFALVYFRALKRKPVFSFPSSIRTEKSNKIFLLHQKYSAIEHFPTPTLTLVKCYCGNKMGNPERVVSLHFAPSGSQWQRRIWFILSAHGACHIKWSNTARLGLPVLFLQKQNSPKPKQVHKSFLLQNIFHDSKKIFQNFSLMMELENKKT